MESRRQSALVTTDWLAANLDNPDIRIIDASWYLPTMGRDPRQEFDAAHIPGARFFDLDAISDPASGLPHTLPAAPSFAADMAALGIGDAHHVIVYDAGAIFAGARAWWMVRSYGHAQVSILDGGLTKWKAEGRRLTSENSAPQEARFSAALDDSSVRSFSQTLANVTTSAEQVLDARPHGRFTGQEPEPRAGMRSGHIPNSGNLPFLKLYNKDETLANDETLAGLFAGAGIEMDKPVITTCGSGVTACNLLLGLYVLGHDALSVYDGSWSEWGGRSDTPVEAV